VKCAIDIAGPHAIDYLCVGELEAWKKVNLNFGCSLGV
jgi:hypothetical protein